MGSFMIILTKITRKYQHEVLDHINNKTCRRDNQELVLKPKCRQGRSSYEKNNFFEDYCKRVRGVGESIS